MMYELPVAPIIELPYAYGKLLIFMHCSHDTETDLYLHQHLDLHHYLGHNLTCTLHVSNKLRSKLISVKHRLYIYIYIG